MNLRPVTWFGLEAERALQRPHSFFHADKTEPFSSIGRLVILVKPAAVIMDTETDAACRAQEPDHDIGRAGMLAHILKAFLQDPIEARRAVEREGDRQVAHLDFRFQPRPCLELLHILLDCCFQTDMLQE